MSLLKLSIGTQCAPYDDDCGVGRTDIWWPICIVDRRSDALRGCYRTNDGDRVALSIHEIATYNCPKCGDAVRQVGCEKSEDKLEEHPYLEHIMD